MFTVQKLVRRHLIVTLSTCFYANEHQRVPCRGSLKSSHYNFRRKLTNFMVWSEGILWELLIQWNLQRFISFSHLETGFLMNNLTHFAESIFRSSRFHILLMFRAWKVHVPPWLGVRPSTVDSWRFNIRHGKLVSNAAVEFRRKPRSSGESDGADDESLIIHEEQIRF